MTPLRRLLIQDKSPHLGGGQKEASAMHMNVGRMAVRGGTKTEAEFLEPLIRLIFRTTAEREEKAVNHWFDDVISVLHIQPED